MTVQQITGWFFLACAVFYSLWIIKDIISDREGFRAQPGSLLKIMISEFVVYIIATIGISDFVMNTIVIKTQKLAKPDTLPDSLIVSGIVPGSAIGVMYLMTAGHVDSILIIIMMVGLIIGSHIGAQAVGKMNGKTIKTAMVTLLAVLLVVLIVKNFIAGEPGELTSLSGVKLVILSVCTLFLGFINMLGIPTKPFFTTLFLMLGLSPLTTLALLLGTIPISVITGGLSVVKRKRYNKKLALSAIVTGSTAAVIGCSLAITLDQGTLNILLIVVIVTAIISLIKK